MFKDFGRRLQRDLKKIVDARVLASESRLHGEMKVSILNPYINDMHIFHRRTYNIMK